MLQKITKKNINASCQESGCRMYLSSGKAGSIWGEELGGLGLGSHYSPRPGESAQAQPGRSPKRREGGKERSVKERKGDGRK